MLLASLTTAIWASCLVVGVSGEMLHYSWQPPSHSRILSPAKLIHVALTDDPSPPVSSSDEPAAIVQPDVEPLPPALPLATTAPPAPPLAAVAIPNPEIFAKPVDGPTRTVDVKNAAPAAPSPANAKPAVPAAGSAVRHLTFGQGEGVQPKPDYPREAINGGQQGTVIIRFVVGEDGKIASAEIQTGCRWPLLNQAALLAVRDRWHFSPGPARVYDVPIQYKLTEH
jgi:TonB family protein